MLFDTPTPFCDRFELISEIENSNELTIIEENWETRIWTRIYQIYISSAYINNRE